jgi:hypothetical protein
VPGTSGATTATVSVPATATIDGYRFRAVVTLAGVAKTTNGAVLTVGAITTQPVGTSVAAGSNATFTAAASGGATVTWFVQAGGSGPFVTTGVTTGTLTLNAVTAGMNGNVYKAVFTLPTPSGATQESSTATLTVT